jgi:phosphoenolpyruvate---glycerone phosphotransferase subunit DhaM
MTTAVVVVSHSKTLAEGVKELALQMARANTSVWAVGGTDDGRIGTDATAIHQALVDALQVAPQAVVLMDLGSAHLNTIMAIEMLDEELRSRVFMADAPLVEGAVLAVVSAASGDGAEDVRARAEEAREMRKLYSGSNAS